MNEPQPRSAAARWRLIGCVGLQQFGIRRSVPGTVRYRTGWSVTVDAPRTETLSDGLRVWSIPVTFENGETGTPSVGVAACELEVDGKYQNPFREPDRVRALGDADQIRTLEPGERWSGRLAVS